MGEERPKSKKVKIIKIMTVLILIVVGIIFILKIGLHTTSSSTFCASCHNMSPQVHTWKASSHSEVSCTSCHIAPGFNNLVRQKAGGVKELYYTITDNYLAPIRMPSLIPNESCETCHEMSKRKVSASGDIIIDHDTHDIQEVACVFCHAGVAHGKVAERRVTYKSDYNKWNEMLAKRFMEDTKYTRPQMETCMECHELRGAPLTCDTCHSTSMIPEEHKADGFILSGHFEQAKKDIYYCNTCHSYTTKNQVEGFKGKSAYLSYISGDGNITKEVTVEQYAKKNDYCVNCHSQRPETHNQNFFQKNHGLLAERNKGKCMTCHDFKITSDAPVTNVTCSSCHPSSHNRVWKTRHPVPIANNQEIERTCVQCHVEERCASCHDTPNKEENS